MVKYKILLAGSDAAGHYSGLAKGLEDLGHSVVLAAERNPFGYRGNHVSNGILYLYNAVRLKRIKVPKIYLARKIFLTIFEKLLGALIPFWIIKRFDIVFFGFGHTFTESVWELLLYKFFGIKIVFTFHGSDARPPYLNGALFPVDRPIDSIEWKKMRRMSVSIKRRITRIEKYADVIFAYPAISHFFSKPFYDMVMLGNPVIMDKDPQQSTFDEDHEKVVVLHCPSAPISKGSNEIRKIISELKNKGLKFTFRELSNVSNDIVHKALSASDIVVDSMWNDCPAGTFPAEGLHWYRPVIIGSYFAEVYPKYYPERKFDAPYIFCSPDQVSEKIEELIKSRDLRRKLSFAASQYVNSFGRPESIAERYLRCINGQAPDEWMCDPQSICYVHGYGAPKEHIRYLVCEYIKRYGVAKLEVSHKPKLERALTEFAGII